MAAGGPARENDGAADVVARAVLRQPIQCKPQLGNDGG